MSWAGEPGPIGPPGPTYEYIQIVWTGPSRSGKTQTYEVRSNHGDILGHIAWFGRWRQYTFCPERDTVFSAGCMADIQDMVTQVNEGHKKII